MFENIKEYLYKPKSKIGFGHGIITIFGSIILGYLTMMLYSKFILSDYGVKIIPSMITTPILISFFALWLLFSKNIIKSLQKLFILSFIIILVLKVF